MGDGSVCNTTLPLTHNTMGDGSVCNTTLPLTHNTMGDGSVCNTTHFHLHITQWVSVSGSVLCYRHYPKTSFTAVADTPEMQRLAQNTRQQSQASARM